MTFAIRLPHTVAATPPAETMPEQPAMRALLREHKRLARLGLAGDCDCRYCA